MTEAQAITWAGNHCSTLDGQSVTWNSANQVSIVTQDAYGAYTVLASTYKVNGVKGPSQEPVIIIVK